jgi:hypothetical protein
MLNLQITIGSDFISQAHICYIFLVQGKLNVKSLQITVRGCEFFRAVQNDCRMNANREHVCACEPFSHCETYIMLLCITQDEHGISRIVAKSTLPIKHTHALQSMQVRPSVRRSAATFINL